ncbi:MAG: hypothetical protein IJQ21_06585 [Lachnospiraceae bacterium]|nr:hypothetical protein [Lachnospiraceae bacterium]
MFVTKIIEAPNKFDFEKTLNKELKQLPEDVDLHDIRFICRDDSKSPDGTRYTVMLIMKSKNDG